MRIGNEPIDLRLTLMDSAQCFHWTECDGRFGAAVAGAPMWLWQDGSGIHAEGDCEVDDLRRYLDLDRDYAAIAAEYAGGGTDHRRRRVVDEAHRLRSGEEGVPGPVLRTGAGAEG